MDYVEATIGDKKYRLSRLSKQVQAEFSVWLIARTRKAFMEATEGSTRVWEIEKVIRDEVLMSEKYAWGSTLCKEALESDFGAQKYLLWLLLKPAQPTMTLEDTEELIVEHTQEVMAALNGIR